MFRLENDDAYVGLQVPISIDESIQPILIRGCSTIVGAFNGGANDEVNNVKECATTLIMMVSISICQMPNEVNIF
jgi:hypothetical protein